MKSDTYLGYQENLATGNIRLFSRTVLNNKNNSNNSGNNSGQALPTGTLNSANPGGSLSACCPSQRSGSSDCSGADKSPAHPGVDAHLSVNRSGAGGGGGGGTLLGHIDFRSISRQKSKSLELLNTVAMWSNKTEEIVLQKGEKGLGFSILDYQVSTSSIRK